MPTSSERLDDARMRAFHQLYRGEFSFVWATTRRLGVPPASVEDAVQDVFLVAYRRLDQLHFEVSARAWLYGVARRIAARHRRAAARLGRRLAAVAAATPGPAEPPQDRIAAAQQVDRLLAGLGERSRAAFEMAELLGMSGPEIAAELGIPVSTVYSRVRLAREQLLRELGAAGLERGLADARTRDEAPPEAAQRSWIALLPALTPAGASGGLVALASVRAAMMTTFIVIAGAAAVAWPRARPVGAVGEARSRDEPAAPVPVPGPVPPPDQPPAVATEPAVVAPLASAADRLAAEVALLDRARAELARGAIDGARARLAEHARRFPDGALVDLRRATEIELLCHEGESAAAAARAAALVASHPGSAVAQRFSNFSCPR